MTANPLLERLADRLGGAASSSTVYGDPIERDGVTVVPVSRADWGYGGGWGPDGEGGGGGGGGVRARPVGYIEIHDGKACYKPIVDPSHVLLAVAALLGAVSLIVRAAAKLPPPVIR